MYEVAQRSLKVALAYTCRMRRVEVLRALKSQIQKDGFEVRRAKGSNTAVTKWSPMLSAAINMALELPGHSVFLLHDDRGLPITETAFNSAFRRAQQKAKGVATDWTFHDIKAMGDRLFRTRTSRLLSGTSRPAWLLCTTGRRRWLRRRMITEETLFWIT